MDKQSVDSSERGNGAGLPITSAILFVVVVGGIAAWRYIGTAGTPAPPPSPTQQSSQGAALTSQQLQAINERAPGATAPAGSAKLTPQQLKALGGS